MRAVAPSAAAAFGVRFAMAQLVELSLSTPVRVATCRDTIEWNGKSFAGGKQTAIDAIRDQGGEVVGLSFQLSGVPAEYLAIALAEPIQGKTVTVWTAIFDPDTQAILDVMTAWRGTLDVMPISQSGETATVSVTAEHRGITFARPRGLRYSDPDQQKVSAGDRCLEFIVAQSTHQDVWPAAAYFAR